MSNSRLRSSQNLSFLLNGNININVRLTLELPKGEGDLLDTYGYIHIHSHCFCQRRTSCFNRKTLCTACPYKFQPPLEKLNREATELHLFSEDYVTCKLLVVSLRKRSVFAYFCSFLIIFEQNDWQICFLSQLYVDFLKCLSIINWISVFSN